MPLMQTAQVMLQVMPQQVMPHQVMPLMQTAQVMLQVMPLHPIALTESDPE
jgi:hypothetical protein